MLCSARLGVEVTQGDSKVVATDTAGDSGSETAPRMRAHVVGGDGVRVALGEDGRGGVTIVASGASLKSMESCTASLEGAAIGTHNGEMEGVTVATLMAGEAS